MSNKLQPVAEDQIYNDTDVNYNSLSPAEKRKLQKEERILQKKKDKWKIYLDFLLRHITIVTSKYIKKKNEFELFKEAIEKAQRLDEKDQKVAATFKKLRLRSEILETKKYFSECNMIRKFLDFIARMKGLNLVSINFYKDIKKAKLEPLTELNNHMLYWKGFLAPNYDMTVLQPIGVDATHPGMKYVMWLCIFRTLLNLSQKFLQSSSALTEISLASSSPLVAFNLTEEQQLITEKMENTLSFSHQKYGAEESIRESLSLNLLNTSALKNKSTETLTIPGETNYLTFELPLEPPKETKKGKKGKKKKGKKKKKK